MHDHHHHEPHPCPRTGKCCGRCKLAIPGKSGAAVNLLAKGRVGDAHHHPELAESSVQSSAT